MSVKPKYALWCRVDGVWRQLGRISDESEIRAKAAGLMGAAAAVGRSVEVEVRVHVPVPRGRLDRARRKLISPPRSGAARGSATAC